ncbi:MAG TPA: phosphate ABC transporter substrate-binding protein PstS [Solirubrobacteraceae bacterium]|nr:phosphate ABC transporter substrate-binding protein PstS [Solirubrobacteraceae bacterium]
MRYRIPAAIGAAALALVVAACGSSSSSTSSTAKSSGTANGAGSTFAAPIYQQWGSNLKGQGVTINYQAVGSGAGIAQLQAGTVDFAGSDPPLAAADKAGLKKGPVTQLPMALGAITVSYNVSGLKTGLKLDGATIANIFLGKITKWNDPAIAALNPGISLPSQTISVVHRSDSSGTTKGFAAFLAAYSPTWKSKVGVDKTLNWPTGTGAKGNDGVAAAIKQTPGAVGYVEQAYALQNNFTYASVKNSSGNYIAPTLNSTTAAAEGITIPSDLGITTINSPNPQAYPIASQTFVDMYTDLCKDGGMSSQNAKALAAFVNYGLGDGQTVLTQLSYAKLPSSVLTPTKTAASKLTCNGQPIS